MERVEKVYMVARISSYADLDTFKIYHSYERAVNAFKAEIGQVLLDAINDSSNDKVDLYDYFKDICPNIYLEDLGDNCDCPCLIPTLACDFETNSNKCIIFNLNSNDRIELRQIEEVI